MILKLENLSKEYRGYNNFPEQLLGAATLGLYSGGRKIEALKNISIELGSQTRGEIVGVVGLNGAGKSTLLNILSGISHPTFGSVEFQGSVRSILELGIGFSPELTADQNILFNGVLWGYTPDELKAYMDAIIEFADLERFRRMPLKTYSTGMQMRLAFGIATLKSADLLLVDEALSVGDASFQQKGIRRFQEYREQGSLVLLVSHDLSLLISVCDRILLLHRGELLEEGLPGKVIARYRKIQGESSRIQNNRVKELLPGEYRAILKDETGMERFRWAAGENATLAIALNPLETLHDVTVGIHLMNGKGEIVFGTNSRLLGYAGLTFPEGQSSLIQYKLTMNLGPGEYTVGLSIHRGLSHLSDCYLWSDSLFRVVMDPSPSCMFEGTAYLAASLVLDEKAIDQS